MRTLLFACKYHLGGDKPSRLKDQEGEEGKIRKPKFHGSSHIFGACPGLGFISENDSDPGHSERLASLLYDHWVIESPKREHVELETLLFFVVWNFPSLSCRPKIFFIVSHAQTRVWQILNHSEFTRIRFEMLLHECVFARVFQIGIACEIPYSEQISRARNIMCVVCSTENSNNRKLIKHLFASLFLKHRA